MITHGCLSSFLFFCLPSVFVCLHLNLSETWILSRLLLVCLHLNEPAQEEYGQKTHMFLHAPQHVSLHARQEQQPITLSPELRQRMQHYLVWWLSKCSLCRARSYFQTISQDDNSPTLCTAPLSSICSHCWDHSFSHCWRQKVPSQRHIKKIWRNLNLKQMTVKAAFTWRSPLLMGQRITLCGSTCSEREGRYLF